MKTAVFLVGHFWVLVGLILILGGCGNGPQPSLVRFFGVGAWFYAPMYGFVTFCCFLLGIWLIVAASRMRSTP